MIKKLFPFLFSKPLSPEQTREMEYVKTVLIAEIKNTVESSQKLKIRSDEVLISIVYLKIFSAWLKTKKFRTIEEAWQFMNDTKTIVQKVFYVKNNLSRKEDTIKVQHAPGSRPE